MIHKVINSKNPRHQQLEEKPYEDVCSKAMAFIEQIIDEFGEPFLIKVIFVTI